ncbi:MAG: preprotein translocase subunit SecA [Bacteroidetes bacterium ADurb.Bin090]|nr:MAG: preprotein translocase subunit SecA [Bacteroidetes bacterium ADurb.Bin090]
MLKAYCLFDRDDEYVVVDNKVKIVDEQTGRIMEGRRYSDGLHQAIEAKERVTVEAATQTFATITLQNYFRMYHKLSGMTGTAETEAGEFWDIYKLDVVVIPTNKPIARNDMDDRLYKTKREKYTAVIEEIIRLVEAGRPVLVGTTSVEISELLSRTLKLRKIKHDVLNAKLHQREAEIVANAGQKGVVTIATNMAGRGTDIKLTEEVRKAGGLAIIGTERHESRRVDRQLRGRSGRQGDPGSSVFYVSLEDDLMRLFGSERISGIMDRMGLEEGELIENPMISKAIERAQKKVEENNFGIRKRLLEYDDVMNNQREVIYTRRRHALMGERIGMHLANTIYDTIKSLVEEAYDQRDFEGLKMDILKYLAMEVPMDEEHFYDQRAENSVDEIYEAALNLYKRKTEKMASIVNPVIQQVYEKQAAQYENILIPITDGKRTYNIPCNLKAAAESQSKEVVKTFEKAILLHTIDEAWKENLRELDELRQSVQNASYEQKDPLLIYKLESYNLFKTMIDNINKKSISILMRGQIPIREPESVRKAETQKRHDYSKYRAQRDSLDGGSPARRAGSDREQRQLEPVRVEKKVGRNDPCPCGSGKKYKNCHGRGL